MVKFSGNLGKLGFFGEVEDSGQNDQTESDLINKYLKLLPEGHPGIQFVNNLSNTPGYLIHGRVNTYTGQIEIARNTPEKETEFTLAHEIGHELTEGLVSKTPGYLTLDHLENGKIEILISEDTPPIQKLLLDFWESIYRDGGITEYGDSYRENTENGMWPENIDLFHENLAEAYAAINVGGEFLENAKARNSKAIDIATNIFGASDLNALWRRTYGR